MSNEFKTLTDREHILLRPAMYIGAVDLTKTQEYVLEDNKMNLQEISYVPGLIKIINEVIDNSVDVAIKTKFEYSNKIDIKIDSVSVSVKDNGTGIPIKKMQDGKYIPLAAWGSAKSGSNFSDDANRTQIGMNGVGSYATNCFSKKFIGRTDDGKNSYEVQFENNASMHKEKLGSSKQPGTEVQFYPDLERFGIKEIDSTHIKVIEQRLINLSMSFPEVTFKLNGKKINSGSFKKFAEMFGDDPVILETEKYRYAILYNTEDDFRHFSYVNGLKIPEGGTHIEAVIEPVVSGVREKLQKKYKDIKPADIRNKLLVIAFLKDLPNPKFNSQTKEKITNSRSELVAYLGNIDLVKLTNMVLKNKPIIDGITEIYRIKEEFKKRQDLKSLNKVKKIKSDKYISALKRKKYLMLVEGECLDENTEVFMSDFTSKKIKDIKIGDEIISSDFSKQKVLGQSKLLKETITIKTENTEVIMGKNHKLKVYCVKTNSFKFVTGQELLENKNDFKILRSKINTETLKSKITHLNFNKMELKLTNGEMLFTEHDYFIVLRNNLIQRIHAMDLIIGDFIIFS